jgi:hypothetical protein
MLKTAFMITPPTKAKRLETPDFLASAFPRTVKNPSGQAVAE